MPDNTKLKPRAVFPKPKTSTLAGAVLHNVLVLKWAEGTHIRGVKKEFIFDDTKISPSEKELLKRGGIDIDMIKQDVATVNQIFAADVELQFLPMFRRPESDLTKEKEDGEKESGEELADLCLYFYLLVKKIGFADTQKLIDRLNSLSSVEIAYPQPIPFPAQTDVSPTTPDFSLVQSYLEPAPQGIDAYYAWIFRGGKGDFTHIIDIECGWHFQHEDLPVESSLRPKRGINFAGHNHGTAVLGILAAGHNNYGIDGIVPRTQLGVDSPVGSILLYDVAGSINRSAADLSRGGIILIEQHYPFGQGDDPFAGLFGEQWVPVEEYQGEFDAIHNATARGIIIVEAAGNGNRDLDSPIFRRRYDRTVRDSGAILVGAGKPYTGLPEDFSNFGRRVDVQGWGSNVMTLSENNMVVGTEGDVRQQYRENFSGTSSASPIVAGAAGLIQSIRRAHGLEVLNSIQMRSLLRDTGTPGMSSPRNIGPLPNLRKAIDSMRLPGLPAAGWSFFSDFPTDSSPVVLRDSSGALACFVIRGSQLWWRRQIEPFLEWSIGVQLGNQLIVGELAGAVNSEGCLQIFARGTDRSIWTIRQLFPGAGSAWSQWTSLTGIFSGNPVVVLNTNRQLEVFARGSDDQLYTNFQDNVAAPWSGWIPMGGRLSSMPAVALQADGTLSLVAVFKDRTLRMRSRNAGRSWEEDWRDSGGIVRDTPAITQNGAGGVNVFVRGLDNALFHIQRIGENWIGFDRIGGELAPHSAPFALLSPFGKVCVFVRWTNNTVRFTTQSDDLTSWLTLEREGANLGGGITGTPVAVFHADGRYDLFARTWNGSLITTSHRIGG